MIKIDLFPETGRLTDRRKTNRLSIAPLSPGLVIATIAPVMILVILCITYLVALRRNNHHSRNSSGRSSFFRLASPASPAPGPAVDPPESPGARSHQQAEEQKEQEQEQELQEQELQGQELQEQQQSEAVVVVIQNRHLSVALFVLFVVYATVSYIVFETFVCDGFEDGTSYLRADYSIECESS